jgi:tetratricopeptide (TPR) repeat protein
MEFVVGGSEVGGEIGQDFGGVIGRNILSYADTEYDLASGAIRLMRTSGCSNHQLAYWATGKPYNVLDILPSTQRRVPPVTVMVSVNGTRIKALLDTGAPASVLSLSAAKRAGLATAGDAIIQKGVSGGFGRRLVEAFVVPLPSIKIGDEEIKNTKIQVMGADLPDADMLMGADFFLSHRVFVAVSQEKVYFTYNGGPVFNLVAKPLGVATNDTPPVGAPNADAAKPGASDSGDTEPKDAAGFSRRGGAFADRRDYPAAMADLDRAVAMAPDNADYVYQRAKVRLANGQVFLAMADVEQTLKLRPGDPDALMTRAELRFMGHDRSAGLADLDAVAKSAPPAADVRLRLAGLYERWDRLTDAIAQYNLWITAHPDDNRHPLALNGRCWARGLLGEDLDKALADCDAAHRTIPKNASFLDSRGLVHLRLGHLDKAIADYDASLAIQPKNAWSLYGRGLAKLKSGDAEGGKADLAAAVAVNSGIAARAAKYGLKP